MPLRLKSIAIILLSKNSLKLSEAALNKLVVFSEIVAKIDFEVSICMFWLAVGFPLGQPAAKGM